MSHECKVCGKHRNAPDVEMRCECAMVPNGDDIIEVEGGVSVVNNHVSIGECDDDKLMDVIDGVLKIEGDVIIGRAEATVDNRSEKEKLKDKCEDLRIDIKNVCKKIIALKREVYSKDGGDGAVLFQDRTVGLTYECMGKLLDEVIWVEDNVLNCIEFKESK